MPLSELLDNYLNFLRDSAETVTKDQKEEYFLLLKNIITLLLCKIDAILLYLRFHSCEK